MSDEPNTLGWPETLQLAEVMADKELSLPAEADKQARDMAVKEVAMAVKKYLGMQFGLWKKGKAEAVVVT